MIRIATIDGLQEELGGRVVVSRVCLLSVACVGACALLVLTSDNESLPCQHITSFLSFIPFLLFRSLGVRLVVGRSMREGLQYETAV